MWASDAEGLSTIHIKKGREENQVVFAVIDTEQ